MHSGIGQLATRLLQARTFAAWCFLLLRGLLNLQLWYHGSHDDAYRAVVDLVYHVVEELCALQFEDEQWVFLLVAGVVYAVLQLVEQAEVLLPGIIDDVQDDSFVESGHH